MEIIATWFFVHFFHAKKKLSRKLDGIERQKIYDWTSIFFNNP